MSSPRDMLTTTGQSHNKRLNTYASKRNVRELILEKKNKNYINSCDIVFSTNEKIYLAKVG